MFSKLTSVFFASGGTASRMYGLAAPVLRADLRLSADAGGAKGQHAESGDEDESSHGASYSAASGRRRGERTQGPETSARPPISWRLFLRASFSRLRCAFLAFFSLSESAFIFVMLSAGCTAAHARKAAHAREAAHARHPREAAHAGHPREAAHAREARPSCRPSAAAAFLQVLASRRAASCRGCCRGGRPMSRPCSHIICFMKRKRLDELAHRLLRRAGALRDARHARPARG